MSLLMRIGPLSRSRRKGRGGGARELAGLSRSMAAVNGDLGPVPVNPIHPGCLIWNRQILPAII